jgi:hypothetical protein
MQGPSSAYQPGTDRAGIAAMLLGFLALIVQRVHEDPDL